MRVSGGNRARDCDTPRFRHTSDRGRRTGSRSKSNRRSCRWSSQRRFPCRVVRLPSASHSWERRRRIQKRIRCCSCLSRYTNSRKRCPRRRNRSDTGLGTACCSCQDRRRCCSLRSSWCLRSTSGVRCTSHWCRRLGSRSLRCRRPCCRKVGWQGRYQPSGARSPGGLACRCPV